MKKKISVSLICGMLIMLTVITVAFATTGSFKTHGWYSSNCWVSQVPLIINDEVTGNTGCKTSCASPIDNYMYVKVSVGKNSSTCDKHTAYAFRNDNCGTQHSYYSQSKWGETYHIATCYTHDITETKTVTYNIKH